MHGWSYGYESIPAKLALTDSENPRREVDVGYIQTNGFPDTEPASVQDSKEFRYHEVSARGSRVDGETVRRVENPTNLVTAEDSGCRVGLPELRRARRAVGSATMKLEERERTFGRAAVVVGACWAAFEWADGRYRLHDLARCFAESRLDEGEGAEFRCRHARHYVGVLEEAENLYLQGGEGVRTGLSLLDREWANIEAGQAWPELHAEDSPEMAAVCSAYPQAGSHCLWFRLSLPALIRWQETALASARRIGDRRAEGRHLGLLGRAFIASGDSRLSVQLGTEAVEVAREVGDRSGEGINLAFLGVTHYYLGDLHCAVELIEQAVGLSRNAGDCRKEVADLGCLAGVYSDLGERHHAIELYEEALIVARETGNHYAEAGILPSLGFTVARLGDPRRALECYRQALLLVRGIGDRSLECHILDNLADAYTDLGEPRKAIKIADRALSIADEIGNRRQEGQVLTTLGRAFWAIGKQDRAVELWERSRDLGREVGDRRTEGLASWYLGLVHEEAGQLELAADLLKVRVDYERAIGSADAEGLAAKVDEIRARSCGH